MRAVYATDLSEAIESAIGSRTCLECLERYGIEEIHLITVTSPNVTTGMPGSDVGERTQRALDRQRTLLEAEGFAVETHAMRGTPHRRINGLAERVDADLIIVGSRGQSPLERRLIGSTARNVARTAVRPLLVQRIVEREGEGEDGDDHEVASEHLFQRVLYATDFSENAQQAFQQFRNLGTATQEVTLLHVAPPGRRSGSETDRVEDAEARLAELADELEGMGIETRTVVREGEAVEEILAAETEFDPTTILLGSRGRSRMRRLLLGSVSADVTAQANANVLLVPPSGTR
jgi:nucleotide-binding universal stress UspA family protein